jgi:hypothetical protein
MSDRRHIVTDKSMEQALDWLRDHAPEMGKAKERSVKAGHMVKHILHIEMKRSDEKTAAGKERDAYASKAYLDACEEDARAAGALEMMRSLREAAALKIEAWRTEQANWRSMKI